MRNTCCCVPSREALDDIYLGFITRNYCSQGDVHAGGARDKVFEHTRSYGCTETWHTPYRFSMRVHTPGTHCEYVTSGVSRWRSTEFKFEYNTKSYISKLRCVFRNKPSYYKLLSGHVRASDGSLVQKREKYLRIQWAERVPPAYAILRCV